MSSFDWGFDGKYEKISDADRQRIMLETKAMIKPITFIEINGILYVEGSPDYIKARGNPDVEF